MDEEGTLGEMQFDTRREAMEEADPEDGLLPYKVRSWAAGPGLAKLLRTHGYKRTSTETPAAFALMEYTHRFHPELDGVWWDDDVWEWGAPRGGIHPARLKHWRWTQEGIC